MMPCACAIFHDAAEVRRFECSCECHATERPFRWLAPISEPLTVDGLTPSECSDLRLISERARADDNSADLAPMLRNGRVIPWLEAINLDPALGY